MSTTTNDKKGQREIMNDTSMIAYDSETVARMDETLRVQQQTLGELRGQTFSVAALTATAMIELRKTFRAAGVLDQIVMPLRGSKLGFRTDRDINTAGRSPYTPEELIDPLIEGLLKGARLTGNEINVIAGNCYLTREFFDRALGEMDGLDYKITHGIPQATDKGAVVKSQVTYKYKGSEDSEELALAIKGDKYTSVDGYKGKADRKARAWLYQRLTGMNCVDADVDDPEAINVTATEVTHPLEGEALANGNPTDIDACLAACEPRRLRRWLTHREYLMPGQSVEGLELPSVLVEQIMADTAGFVKSVNEK